MAQSYLANLLSSAGVDASALKGVPTETVAFAAALDSVAAVDPAIATSIVQELRDQRSKLKLIASENFASPAVLLAMGNWLSATSTPRARPATASTPAATTSTRSRRARPSWRATLFGADHAYVQPHSGIDANLVAFWTVLTARVENPRSSGSARRPSPIAVGRGLGDAAPRARQPEDDGHGARRGRPPHARLPPQRLGQAVPVLQLRASTPRPACSTTTRCGQAPRTRAPLLLIAGYSSYPRKINFRIFREIADEVGATLMVDMAHFAGLVAGQGVHRRLRSGAARAHRDHDHAQDAARPARRAGAVPEGARRDRRPRLSAGARRAAAARDGGQGGRAATRPPSPSSRSTRPRVVDNARALAEALMAQGRAVLVTGGTENHLCCIDVRELRAQRPPGRGRAARARHHRSTAT